MVLSYSDWEQLWRNSKWQSEMNYFDWIKFHCFGPDIENWFRLNLCFVYENIQTNEKKIKTKPVKVCDDYDLENYIDKT